MCLKLANIKETRLCFGVFVVNSEQISHMALVSLLLLWTSKYRLDTTWKTFPGNIYLLKVSTIEILEKVVKYVQS